MPQPPKFLFLDTNLQCNLKCKHCMYWTRPEIALPTHITIERRAEIIDEFSQLNPSGTVVICGGESMMNPDRYYAISRQCRQLGLKCFSVVNGTMITTPEDAEKMILEGASEVTISLNSHIKSVHDYTRGMDGSFEFATNAIKLLLEARDKLGKTTPIYAMAVICELNYKELDGFYDYVLNELKADKLKLNFLQPTFGTLDSMKLNDKFYRNNIITDYDELVRVIKYCDEKYNLNLNPDYIDVVKLYHRSVNTNGDAALGWGGKGTEKPICNSYERNIMVDMNGMARLCFSTGFPGTQLTKFGDLDQFWYGTDPLRKRMSTCTQYCGISHSVRRLSATLK